MNFVEKICMEIKNATKINKNSKINFVSLVLLLKNNFTKFFFRLVSIGFSIIYVSACTPGRFERTPQTKCSSDTGECFFNETIQTNGGMVDILIVNDNSGSMSFEQNKMALRFPNLLQKLDDRWLDYRIGVTTTDVSTSSNAPRRINQNGALQDGRLLSLLNGQKFLEPNTSDKYNLFLKVMQRKETIECEGFINTAISSGLYQSRTEYEKGYYEHCPSGDERGIMSALSSIYYNPDKMIRDEAHLAVVIISDEDERSWGITDPQSPYTLGIYDQPKTFIDVIKQKYPTKSLSVHSIVVKSNDLICLEKQNNQMGGVVKGQYGTVYEQLSNATNGVIGSVCEPDYGEQMGKIGSAIVQQVTYFTLHCANPKDFQVQFEPASSEIGYKIEGVKIHFDKALDPTTKVRFIYECPIID